MRCVELCLFVCVCVCVSHLSVASVLTRRIQETWDCSLERICSAIVMNVVIIDPFLLIKEIPQRGSEFELISVKKHSRGGLKTLLIVGRRPTTKAEGRQFS